MEEFPERGFLDVTFNFFHFLSVFFGFFIGWKKRTFVFIGDGKPSTVRQFQSLIFEIQSSMNAWLKLYCFSCSETLSFSSHIIPLKVHWTAFLLLFYSIVHRVFYFFYLDLL